MGRIRMGVVVAAASVAVLGAVGGQSASAGAPPGKGGGGGGGTVAAPDCGGVTPPKPGGGTYVCTFTDDFDGRSLDSGTWVVGDTSVSGFKVADTCFRPKDGNVRVRGGELQLTTRKMSEFTCDSPYGAFRTEYSGATVSTYGKFDQTYGRFEARVRFGSATGPGIHANFWMNPRHRVYGAWPHSGEIDVAEWFSAYADRAYPSLHYAGRTQSDTGWNCVIGSADAYHTFAVEWQPTVMDFYYDGKLCFSRSWVPDAPLAAPQPFDQPFVMALTNAAGGLWNAPDANTPFPATMSVDYVRAWR